MYADAICTKLPGPWRSTAEPAAHRYSAGIAGLRRMECPLGVVVRLPGAGGRCWPGVNVNVA